MKAINTPKAASDKFGKPAKKLILLNDSRFSKIYGVLESRYRDCSQNTGAADAYVGNEGDGRRLSEILDTMKNDKKIDVDDVAEIRAIFKRRGWDFPELEEKADESKRYGRDHLWTKNSQKRMIELKEHFRNSQVQMEPRDEAKAAAVAKRLNEGKITDEDIQFVGYCVKKYIKN